MTRALLTALALTLATPAAAAEIFDAQGSWQGEGSLATGPEAPMQRGRCRVEIAPEPGGRDVSVVGKCVVAGGGSEISLRLVRGQGGKVNAGVWSAATGQTVQFSGTESASQMRLTNTSPLTLDGTSYEAMVEVAAPDADSFSIRQMLRLPGAESWRMVVDMTYRPAG